MTAVQPQNVAVVVLVGSCHCIDCDGSTAVTLSLDWCAWPDGRRAGPSIWSRNGTATPSKPVWFS